MAALQELLYGNLDLPDGAVPYLLGLPEDQRGLLEHILGTSALGGLRVGELGIKIIP